jgi:hypothetical protein
MKRAPSVGVTAYLSPQRLPKDQRKYKEDWLPHKALNPIDEMQHIEVEQQSDVKAAQLQIRQHLRVMNGCHAFDGLDFYKNSLLDSQIDPVRGINFESVIHDRQVSSDSTNSPAFLS